MNIRSLSFGGLPAACLSSRSTGSIFDHSASLISKRSAMKGLRNMRATENIYQDSLNSSTRPSTSAQWF